MNFLNFFKRQKYNERDIIKEYLLKEYRNKAKEVLLKLERQNKVTNDDIELVHMVISLANVLENFMDVINLKKFIGIKNDRIFWKDICGKKITKIEKKRIREYFGVKTDLHKRLRKD